MRMNGHNPQFIFPYRKRFCGLPIGVSIEPQFAATVCNTTVSMMYFPETPSERSNVIANGTNVMSDTSFVTNMLKKKQRNTSTPQRPRTVFTFAQSTLPSVTNTPHRRKPATTVIKLNKSASVFQSMYCIYAADG